MDPNLENWEIEELWIGCGGASGVVELKTLEDTFFRMTQLHKKATTSAKNTTGTARHAQKAEMAAAVAKEAAEELGVLVTLWNTVRDAPDEEQATIQLLMMGCRWDTVMRLKTNIYRLFQPNGVELPIHFFVGIKNFLFGIERYAVLKRRAKGHQARFVRRRIDAAELSYRDCALLQNGIEAEVAVGCELGQPRCANFGVLTLRNAHFQVLRFQFGAVGQGRIQGLSQCEGGVLRSQSGQHQSASDGYDELFHGFDCGVYRKTSAGSRELIFRMAK
jgi:hypothetical protein